VETISPKLDEIYDIIRHLASRFNNGLSTLEQSTTNSDVDRNRIETLINLRKCVQSAATVVSSASTALALDYPDRLSVAHGSDFGDCFATEPNEPMRRWMTSRTIYEVEDEEFQGPSQHDDVVLSNQPHQRQHSAEKDDSGTQSDSESDEAEKIQALLRRGKEKLAEQDFNSAERLLLNCQSRTSGPGSLSLSALRSTAHSKSVHLLLDTYRRQEKWDSAESLLLNQIKPESQNEKATNPKYVLMLAEVLLDKWDLTAARKHGVRAYKRYRKLGPEGTVGVQSSLRLLIRICSADGDVEEEDAYASILYDVTKRYPTPAQVSHSSSSLPPPSTFSEPVNLGPAESLASGPSPIEPWRMLEVDIKEGPGGDEDKHETEPQTWTSTPSSRAHLGAIAEPSQTSMPRNPVPAPPEAAFISTHNTHIPELEGSTSSVTELSADSIDNSLVSYPEEATVETAVSLSLLSQHYAVQTSEKKEETQQKIQSPGNSLASTPDPILLQSAIPPPEASPSTLTLNQSLPLIPVYPPPPKLPKYRSMLDIGESHPSPSRHSSALISKQNANVSPPSNAVGTINRL
jgi:hypothetical protein